MKTFASIFSEDEEEERIAKRIARTGLCSRRKAEKLIVTGKVAIDGITISSPAIKVKQTTNILVDGKSLPIKEPARLWRYHKRKGQITSTEDAEGRATIFDNLPNHLPRVISVGRLDFDSEGLLLLTNDGELARLMELPSTSWVRRYRVRVYGRPQIQQLEELKTGKVIKGVRYRPIDVQLDKQVGSNAWLTVGLSEGKNREIKKLMESIELKVNRLIRTAYGPFQLGKLATGKIEEIKHNTLKEQLGISNGKTIQNAKRTLPRIGKNLIPNANNIRKSSRH
ncbi:MAG: pseudouridine synthase [Rhodospirillaceae bacterium]|nr:pseudouridine synthase [Rhodospirillaceae bacterium]|tara:strand:+ start:585 stop:1430 length:846 start_codon:yes stop_codon:yes gene_type:complete